MVDNVTPKQAWLALAADPQAQLVDVRTQAEWQLVGVPDLNAVGKQPLLVTWQAPSGQVNPGFIGELRAAGLASGQTLYFICRSGVRSLSAAYAAEAAGFETCINVSEGFEGHPDARGQRGVSGWKADGLAWRRS